MISSEVIEIQKKINNLKVLYIEDEIDVRIAIKELLEIFFKRVCDCATGKEAQEMFSRNNFDIIFTDINLPDTTGFKLARYFRERNNKIPIIICSAYHNNKYLTQAIHMNLDGYLFKPFQVSQFMQAMNNIINKYKLQENSRCIIINQYQWCKKNKVLMQDNKNITLTKNEKKCIAALADVDGHFLEVEVLESLVFEEAYSNKRRIQNVIQRLNKKLGLKLISARYGHGYYLNIE